MKTAKFVGLILWVLSAYLLSAKGVAASLRPTPAAPMVLIREDQSADDVLEAAPTFAKKVSLLNWNTTGELRQKPEIDYNRKKQFGKWIQFKKTKGCFDTRAQVLMRDSAVQTTAKNDKPCTIEKGEWFDPYSGQKLENGDQVQIDHMVPLKEAYEAGAYTWTRAQRCVYANFMGMKEHLITTSNFENLSKADKTPEFYMPPRREYQCTYLKNWLAVKLIWKLSMTTREAQAIRTRMKDVGCVDSEFTISQDKVAQVRQAAASLESTCPYRDSP